MFGSICHLQGLGHLAAVLHQGGEIGVLEILVQLPLAELGLAARLGHEGQVGVDRQLVAQRLGDEDLPRRIRKVLLGADDVRDLEVVVVDHVGQVIEARAVGPLDDVVLLAGPIDGHVAADHVLDDQRSLAGHLQPHDGLAGPRLSNRARSAAVSAIKRRL